MGFELDPSYKDVPQRIADFKEQHPDGCLRPADLDQPYRIECVNGTYFIVYVAAAYRSPDDQLPGIGVAWEPFPGRTPYTKDSELQNAETSAWGRAIVAALRSESKAVASAEDVRNRQADAAVSQEEVDQRRQEVKDAIDALTAEQQQRVQAWAKAERLPPRERITVSQADKALAFIATLTAEDSAPTTGNGSEAANGSDRAPDATQVPAGVDIVAELDHEYSQLGGVQKAAFDAWCRKEALPESRADASRAQVLAAIEKARELRSHTGPIDTSDEAEAKAS